MEKVTPLNSPPSLSSTTSAPRRGSIIFKNESSKLADNYVTVMREGGDKKEDNDEEGDEEEWSFDHARLIYLVSLYASYAKNIHENETWIRHLPLLVLIYEGIVNGNLDYDYAPFNTLISCNGTSIRRWINISQEGKGAIEDMREKKLLNGLKLSTDDFQPSTAYQVYIYIYIYIYIHKYIYYIYK